MQTRASELRDLLNDWDFIGVFDPRSNVDEYDCMIEPLLSKLTSGASSNDIRQFLDAEIAGHFGLSVDHVETAAIAERLTAWWQTGTP